jgi:hypothetical protein
MPLSKEIEIAQKFLDLLEARNLDEVAELITDDFVMVWPGGVRFDDLATLKEWGTGRFQSVKNIYDKIEAAETPMGNAVFFIGTLEGVFADGSAFSGIRFVDRVLVTKGKVSELLVWSDLAEELRRRDL